MSANQGAIRVPLGGAVNLTSVEIMLFMPVSILAGYSIDQGVGLLHWIIERLLHGKGITIIYAALGFAMLAGALSGSQKIIPIINPNTLLFRQADRPAMIWIDHNIPQNAIILINPFLWGYGFFAGADGGYWITPMTGRNTMPPTLLYASGPRSTIQQVNRVAKETLDLAKDPSRLVAMLKEENIQYVYIGRRGGALSPKLLDESGLFRALYQKDGVWIFEVNK
jgi:hypothetical protein